MNFQSILFQKTDNSKGNAQISQDSPACFIDLNLNQIADAITKDKEEYDLKPFFYTHLHHVDDILYRQEIMRDLENPSVFEDIVSFAHQMHEMRKFLSDMEKISYPYQKERFFLDAVRNYCQAINSLVHNLLLRNFNSFGFLSFREYLTGYIQSDRFTSLLTETEDIIHSLSSVKYCVHIKDLRIQVLPYSPEEDYSVEVEQLFSKFRQEAVKDYRKDFPFSLTMNRVEAGILDGVAELYPDLFSRLNNFYQNRNNFQDETLITFDREIQFYISYLEYIVRLKQSGLKFCYPKISGTGKEIYNYDGFDLALAYKLTSEKKPVVCNDFYLKNEERIIIVTGPNQGGKTTFARTFGQLHYLACLGLPVPGRDAQLFLYDNLLTHFERQEDVETHRSKFENDLIDIHSMISKATSDSILIMNEILSSTALQDAVYLSNKILEKIIELDALCVWVTFIDEVAGLSKKMVSMVSTVNPEDPTVRTFKIIRKPADGLAYALSIAEKYKVTYQQLKERTNP